MITEEKTHPSVSRMAGVLASSRPGHCAQKGRGPSAEKAEDKRLKVPVWEVGEASFGTYGAPRIHAELQDAYAIGTGRKRVAPLMRELGIEGVLRREKGKVKNSASAMPAFPHLVKRPYAATRPRGCRGWSMRGDLTAELVVDALGVAESTHTSRRRTILL